MIDFKIENGFLNVKRVVAIVIAVCLFSMSMGTVSFAETSGDYQISNLDEQTPDEAEEEEIVPATKVTLNRTKATIYKKKVVVLKATKTPINSTDKITWKTSNKKVATVRNGVVKGVGKGTTTITAITTSGKEATCIVKVKEVASKSVKLNKSKATIKIGKKFTLKSIVKPKNSTDDVIWETSNEEVATVTSKGVVKGIAAGTVKITVTVGEKVAKCKVTIKAVKATSLKLNKSNATIKSGKKLKLKATLKPQNTTDEVIWISSDEGVVTVTSKGVVKGIRKGTALITAKTTGGKTVNCKVTVKN